VRLGNTDPLAIEARALEFGFSGLYSSPLTLCLQTISEYKNNVLNFENALIKIINKGKKF